MIYGIKKVGDATSLDYCILQKKTFKYIWVTDYVFRVMRSTLSFLALLKLSKCKDQFPSERDFIFGWE